MQAPISSVRLTFNESIDPAGFTQAQVLSFTGPGGRDINVVGVTAVAGSNDRKFDITFDEQSELGSYQFTLSTEIRDTSGNLIDQDRDGLNGEPIQDEYVGTFTLAEALVYSATDVPSRIDP